MKLTLKLTNIYFKETLFGLMGGRTKKQARKILPTLMLIFFVLAAAIGYSLYNTAKSLAMFGGVENILIIGLIMAVFVSLMITLNDTQGTMYKSKDYDILMSLPLKNVYIITAKYFSTYLISLVYFCAVALPTFVVYFMFMPVTFLGILFAVVATAFMPALSQLVSCVLGWVVNALAAKMRNKNIVRVIISLIMVAGVAVFMSFANSNLFSNLFVSGVPTWFKIIFANIYLLFKAITKINFLYFLALIALCLALVVLGVMVITLGYHKINSSLASTKIKANAKIKPLKFNERSTFNNLFRKEVKTFFNSPVYCINCLMGNIMCIVVTVICLVLYNQLKMLGGVVVPIMAAIEVFGVAMCTGIAPTTSVSVSMEGSKLQTIKSLPLKFKNIALSKLALNLVLALPTVTLSAVLFCAIVPVGWVAFALMLLYFGVTVFAQSALGLLFNLRFPRINWTNETQAVKSGLSLLITMLIDMLLSVAPMVIYLVIISKYSWFTLAAFVGIALAVQLVVLLIIGLLLVKFGEKLFKKIQV